MTNTLDFRNYSIRINDLLERENKVDGWGWKITDLEEDHIDLHWDYDINFRITLREEDDLSWIKSVHDYGYGLDSKMVEDFTSLIVGSDWIADVSLEDAPVEIIYKTIQKARNVY